MEKVTSADGTTIAYERYGSGEPLIMVGGALCDRGSFRELAQELGSDFTTVTYDRRGRGDSGDTDQYAVAREVEDLGALITALGGTAAVYGHSSGAALVVEAAAAGLPISKVVLHEPPYSPDDEEALRESAESGAVVLALLAEDRRQEAVAQFLQMAGLPEEPAKEYAADPGVIKLAHTLAYEFAVVGDTNRDGLVPVDLVAAITQPTLALCGSASPDFMIESARTVAKHLPNGTYRELEGQEHAVPTEVLAPALRDFLG
ncbi:pimeloyl-ACP methyl ester carboxylesterase [Kribbella amoyensis]|uniref:Pimeloyl-ACP methyl ester carboxylesterase n=1 Tax=Kribbella amoyensis TaxID=996641 RepID=A0A561BK87_9ACTN|nr:alpha/beta hydrolase [Kribbella amoyensis]TWD79280.1 pimeloyl-ACP methyl ester carboxylesterase [Kribbella amoyensis]